MKQLLIGFILLIALHPYSANAEKPSQKPQDRLQRNSDLLEPANEPTPHPSPHIVPEVRSRWPAEAFTASDSEMTVVIGNLAVSTAESSFVVLRLYDKDLIKISRVGTGISVSADVWNEEGKILVTIEDNKLRVNSKNTIPILRPDPHTLIVEDERKERVLSVRFLNPKAIKIEGIFRAGGKYPVIIDEKTVSFGPLLIRDGIGYHVRGKAIFDFPGKIPGKKNILRPDDNIEPDDLTLGLSAMNSVVNIIAKDTHGAEYSLVQLGQDNVPGPKFWAAFDAMFQHSTPISY